ncbi:unnamed protein product [Camellia sinensis]
MKSQSSMNQKNKEKNIEDDSKKQGDHGGPISPPGRSYKAATGIVIRENEKPTPMNQKNKGRSNEDDSKKRGNHGGLIGPTGSYKGAKCIVIEGNKNPTPSVLHEKKNENLSKKQGDHGRPISPTGSYKGTKAAVSRKNEKITIPVLLNYLFQVQLTHNYVTNKMVSIPTKEAEEHFPLLKKHDGNYMEVGIQVYDPGYKKFWIRFKFSKLCDVFYSYMIVGRWGEFIDAHELKESDVIRVFKVSKL